MGPLAGLKVIELAHVMAGPTCGLMLADMGADVIKLEKLPDGDDSRRSIPPVIQGEAAAYLMMNRNKRGIAVDLKHPQGLEIGRRWLDHDRRGQPVELAQARGRARGERAEERFVSNAARMANLPALVATLAPLLRQRSSADWLKRFEAAGVPAGLNAHVHFHCCVIDGVFAPGEDGQVHFSEAGALTPEDLAAVQQQVRARVLRWLARAGHLDPADARDMAGWDHGGGFSLDASVRIDAAHRAGLERLLRYCARPPFALERLEQLAHDQVIYRFPRPQPDGRTELRLTPLELIERLAALIPPPCAPLPAGDPAQHAERSPARILWALLLARIYEILPLR
jgi:hypothetical protein